MGYKVSVTITPVNPQKAIADAVRTELETFFKFARESLLEAGDFIRDVKLNLPGPPVRKGGASGPSPGGQDEPVLHRDYGLLQYSIREDPNDPAVAQFIDSFAGAIETGDWVGPRTVKMFIRVANFQKTDEAGRIVHTHDYAHNQEVGVNIPARPYMACGAQKLLNDVNSYINNRAGGGP